MRHSDTELNKMLIAATPKDAADRAYPYAHAAGHWQFRTETLVGWLREAYREIDRLERAAATKDPGDDSFVNFRQTMADHEEYQHSAQEYAEDAEEAEAGQHTQEAAKK